jgi:subtilisin family serine protease
LKRYAILSQSLPTGINRIDAELNAISNIDGIYDSLDIDIAIIDTGIDPNHPDLNVAGGVNYVNAAPNGWVDGHGHGTHVAGTAAASDNEIGVVGVAPDARLWAIKVMSDSGSGSLIDIIQGIDWVTANAGIIDVANLSLGGYGLDDNNCGYTNFDSLHTAICNSVAQGVVYAVAAGNSNTNAMTTIPASYNEVITVSAVADFDGLPGGNGSPTCRTDVDDTLADFSNYGHDVDIAAPGVCINSTWKGGGYVLASGTSMASPHVAGAAALYIIENGKPTNSAEVELVRQGLINSATPQNDPDGFTGDDLLVILIIILNHC